MVRSEKKQSAEGYFDGFEANFLQVPRIGESILILKGKRFVVIDVLHAPESNYDESLICIIVKRYE